MTTFSIGIDPGLSGAIALLRNGEYAEVCRLREALSYDQETGQFRWLIGKHKGEAAGTLHKSGYRYIQLDGRLHRAHRLAWAYVHGEFPKDHIDHINGSRDDNRIANLREATNAQNRQNMRHRRRDKSVGRLGAFWISSRGKWEARITVEGRCKFLGYFETEAQAHAAYVEAKAKEHPFWSGVAE